MDENKLYRKSQEERRRGNIKESDRLLRLIYDRHMQVRCGVCMPRRRRRLIMGTKGRKNVKKPKQKDKKEKKK